MTTMELDARKAGLVREILTKVNSIELLDKLSKYLHKHLQTEDTYPCSYSVQELEQILDQGMEDYQSGHYYTSEQMDEILKH